MNQATVSLREYVKQNIQGEAPAPAFEPERICMTPGAMEALKAAYGDTVDAVAAYRLALVRHMMGDWGEMSEEDKKQNDMACSHNPEAEQGRLMSVFPIDYSKPCENDNRLWVITEWDRSVCTLLLPDEY